MDAVAALRTALEEAHAELAGGDALEAERRAKAVAALVKAERELAEFAAATVPEDDEQELRAELARRLDRLARSQRDPVPDEILQQIADLAHPE